MSPSEIIADFRKKVCDKISVEAEGIADRFVVFTPFLFDDGDHFVVVLKRDGDDWILTDEGNTFMHMEYSGVDFSGPQRQRVIEDAMDMHGIKDRGGELVATVPDGRFGDALFSFVQALSQISSVTKITKEFVESTFLYEFDSVISQTIPKNSLIEHWRSEFDPEGNYEPDFYVKRKDRPWLIFGINSDNKCREATISCLFLEKHMDFESLAIFENQTDINRRAIAQLSDVVGKQFSSLGDKERIAEYIKREILGTITPPLLQATPPASTDDPSDRPQQPG